MPATVTTNRYSPTAPWAVMESNVGSISLGLLPPFSKSSLVVLDATLSGIQSAGNLGFGIASAEFGNANVSDVLRYMVVDSLSDVVEPTLPVLGLSGQDGQSNVIGVGFRGGLSSNYVVLMAVAPGRPMANGCFTIKWFFEFAMEE